MQKKEHSLMLSEETLWKYGEKFLANNHRTMLRPPTDKEKTIGRYNLKINDNRDDQRDCGGNCEISATNLASLNRVVNLFANPWKSRLSKEFMVTSEKTFLLKTNTQVWQAAASGALR